MALKEVYILVNNEPTGPFSLDSLQRMLASGEIPPDTLYAEEGMASWGQLSTVVGASDVREAELGSEIQPDAEIGRCEQLSDSLQGVSTYPAAKEWMNNVAQEAKALPATLRCFDQMIAGQLRNLDEARRNFEQRSFLKRVFGSHDLEEAVSRRISVLREQRERLVRLVEGMRQKGDVVPDSRAKRDLLVKEIRHHMKELRAKKKEATMAATEIRREARVASDGAGKTWLGLYDSSLAADQRRGIRHAKEEALRPYEDAKEAIDRQIMTLERHQMWLESFE